MVITWLLICWSQSIYIRALGLSWNRSYSCYHPETLDIYHDGLFNTLRPRQNSRHFADDTFKHIFLNENVRISIKISLKFVLEGPMNNIPALVQIMAWRRPGDKPLSEPMMVSSLTHICVTRPQWVKYLSRMCRPIDKDNHMTIM